MDESPTRIRRERLSPSLVCSRSVRSCPPPRTSRRRCRSLLGCCVRVASSSIERMSSLRPCSLFLCFRFDSATGLRAFVSLLRSRISSLRSLLSPPIVSHSAVSTFRVRASFLPVAILRVESNRECRAFVDRGRTDDRSYDYHSFDVRFDGFDRRSYVSTTVPVSPKRSKYSPDRTEIFAREVRMRVAGRGSLAIVHLYSRVPACRCVAGRYDEPRDGARKSLLFRAPSFLDEDAS